MLEGFKDIYDVILKEELESIGVVYKKVVGFEKDSVNEKVREIESVVEKLGLKSFVDWIL